MVSSPGYDPSLLVGEHIKRNYPYLASHPEKPLINRAMQGMYPPGSTFKIANALVALQEGRITPAFSSPCLPSVVGCHKHPPNASLKNGLQYSCNGYFYTIFRKIIEGGDVKSPERINLSKWKKYMDEMGFGHPLGIDLPYEYSGFIPDTLYYDRIYGRNRWKFSTIYSLSIGQGEVLLTPLQMANFAALLANRGKYIVPHFVRGIEGTDSIPQKYRKWKYTSIDERWYEEVIKGMIAAVNEPGGTAYGSRIPGITIAGKTGTAQNPHGKDHSLFIAFAPAENPQIAISVIVENAGFGATYAAPIASLIIEKYLRGTITRKYLEDHILNNNP